MPFFCVLYSLSQSVLLRFQDDIANNDKDKIIIFVETKRKADELTVRMVNSTCQ